MRQTNVKSVADLKKEMDEFVKKFEAGYNKNDDKTLKMLYTDNAVRIDPDGTVTTGNENIRLSYIQSWASTKLALTIKQKNVEKQADGTVIASGTYFVSGTTTAGENIYADGAYTNTMIKENGQWTQVDWLAALNFAVNGLKRIHHQQGADQLAALISPNATLEECYLLAKLFRGIDCPNIDHRIHQTDKLLSRHE
jgi:ketosteroid isomerase-like protein